MLGTIPPEYQPLMKLRKDATGIQDMIMILEGV